MPIEQFITQTINQTVERRDKEILDCLPEEKKQDFTGLERMDYWDDVAGSSKDSGYNDCLFDIQSNLKQSNIK